MSWFGTKLKINKTNNYFSSTTPWQPSTYSTPHTPHPCPQTHHLSSAPTSSPLGSSLSAPKMCSKTTHSRTSPSIRVMFKYISFSITAWFVTLTWIVSFCWVNRRISNNWGSRRFLSINYRDVPHIGLWACLRWCLWVGWGFENNSITTWWLRSVMGTCDLLGI